MAERSSAGWGLAQCVVDQGQNAFQIFIHFIIPEAQYPKPIARKMSIARCVTLCMSIQVVLSAVHFHDQALLETDKIQDVSVTRCLATEVKSKFSPCAQMNP